MRYLAAALLFCFGPIVALAQTVTTPEYVDPRGLNQAQRKAMYDHPDPDLLDNLYSRKFSAISDARWSRWNQWQVLRAFAEDKKCGSYMAKYYPGQNNQIGTILVKASLDSSYFLRKPADSINSEGNADGFLLYLSPDSQQTYKQMKAEVTSATCDSKRVQGIIVGLSALYQERSSLKLDQGTPPAPPSATSVPPLQAVGNDPLCMASCCRKINVSVP